MQIGDVAYARISLYVLARIMTPFVRLLRVLLACVLALSGIGWLHQSIASVGAVQSPSGVLLLGTGTHGVYRSIDLGQTWQPVIGLPAGGVWQVQADPVVPNMAFADTGSLFRTTDAGQHWQPVAGVQASGPGFTALTTQGSLLLAAGTSGLVAGGGSRRWVPVSLPVPGGAPRRLLGAGLNLLYAVGADRQLYLHGNLSWSGHGVGWQRLTLQGPVTDVTYVPQTVQQDPNCPELAGCVVLYAAVAGHGVWQSDDSGHNWTQEATERDSLPFDCTVRALYQPADAQGVIYAAVEGKGLYRSLHSGQFWKLSENSALGLTITALVQVGSTIVAATAGQGIQLYAEDSRAVQWRAQGKGLPPNALGLSLAWLPSPSPAIQSAPQLSNHCRLLTYQVCDPFLRFYDRYRPSIIVFGFAISPLEYDTLDHHILVQYFDRARFEYRPDQPGGVHLTPLGRLLTAGRRFPRAPVISTPGAVFIPQTGYSVGPQFFHFWQRHGGPTVLGYPISDLLDEGNNDGSGRIYLMQYFENGRLEFHPENSGTKFAILSGLTGREYRCKRTGDYCHN